MTRAARGLRLEFSGPTDILEALRKGGGRATAPRRAVIDALFAAEGPVSAEYIAGGRDGHTPKLELTSVYRTLEQLEELGAVRHVHIGHSAGLYALIWSEATEYLACERCNRVTSVDSARLDGVREEVRRLFGYEVHFGHFPAVGLCAQCADAQHVHRSEDNHEHFHGDRIHSHPHTHARDDQGGHEHPH